MHLKYTFTAKTFVANTFDLHPKESAKSVAYFFVFLGPQFEAEAELMNMQPQLQLME